MRSFIRTLSINIVFSPHNLVQDRLFNEFNVILCRNVLIYFNKQLQERVHDLLYESLTMFGVLGLGQQETIKFNPREDSYEEIEGGTHLYRRICITGLPNDHKVNHAARRTLSTSCWSTIVLRTFWRWRRS